MKIILNTQVTHISYNKNGVQIKTNRGDFTADAVIVTVPLGVLKNNGIRFTPELPAAKQKAIQQLQMGVVNKIGLKFPQIFWPANYSRFSYVAEQYKTFAFFIDNYHYFKQPVLTGLIGGDWARELEPLSDKDIVQTAMEQLRHLFGNAIPEPTQSLITRWQNDPFSLGSYSYVPVATTGKDYETLAETIEDQIYFAGEATNRMHPATVHGAYISGIREADRIIQSFKR